MSNHTPDQAPYPDMPATHELQPGEPLLITEVLQPEDLTDEERAVNRKLAWYEEIGRIDYPILTTRGHTVHDRLYIYQAQPDPPRQYIEPLPHATQQTPGKVLDEMREQLGADIPMNQNSLSWSYPTQRNTARALVSFTPPGSICIINEGEWRRLNTLNWWNQNAKPENFTQLVQHLRENFFYRQTIAHYIIQPDGEGYVGRDRGLRAVFGTDTDLVDSVHFRFGVSARGVEVETVAQRPGATLYARAHQLSSP